jgi:hypothetical protein
LVESYLAAAVRPASPVEISRVATPVHRAKENHP